MLLGSGRHKQEALLRPAQWPSRPTCWADPFHLLQVVITTLCHLSPTARRPQPPPGVSLTLALAGLLLTKECPGPRKGGLSSRRREATRSPAQDGHGLALVAAVQ